MAVVVDLAAYEPLPWSNEAGALQQSVTLEEAADPLPR
jgi:hypothetical protein